MDNYLLDVEFISFFDDELKMIHYKVNLNIVEVETEEEINIGEAEFYFYNTFMVDDFSDIVEIADEISEAQYDILTILDEFQFGEEIYGKIIIVDSIEIKESYRNQGWGSEALNRMLDYLVYHGMDYIALKPAPLRKNLNDEVRKKSISRLEKFYQQFGFKTLNSRNFEEPCMGMNLNYLEVD